MSPKKKDIDAPRKKYVKKKAANEIPCPHCGQLFPISMQYCEICKRHVVEAIEGPCKDGKCGSCRDGLSKQGQAYMRATRTWNGVRGISAYYDWPEFYDGDQEICNMTVMPVWVDYASGNAH